MNSYKSFMEHGGDIYTEGKFKEISLLDFSSNINFLGIPESFIKNMNKAIESITYYPDLKYRKSKLQIAEYLKQGIKAENIILGNGAAEIINLAVRALKKPCIVVPSFSEYESTAKTYCEEVIFSYLNEEFDYDYEDIFEKLKECDGLVIANPNNPNGGIINKKSFQRILDYCEEHKKKIIVDEAFVEFVNIENQSFVDLSMKYKCLFIIRAFTKFFAMPGIRLGYGISSDREFLEKLIKLQIPWNINCFAEAAAESVLKDEEYISVSKKMHENEREYFVKRLKEFSFIDRIYESHSNFVLIKLKNIYGEVFYDYCISKHILIRRCSNFRGLDDSFIRLAVKNRIDNNKLLEIFGQAEKEISI